MPDFTPMKPVSALNTLVSKNGLFGLYVDRDGDDMWPPEEQGLIVVFLTRNSPTTQWQSGAGSVLYYSLAGPERYGQWDRGYVGFPPPNPPTFEGWVHTILGACNQRLSEAQGGTPPAAVPIPDGADPAEIIPLQDWMRANVHFATATDGKTWIAYGQPPVQPPAPTPSGVIWGPRHFFGGFAYELGVRPDGRPAVRVLDGGWKEATFP